MNNIHPLLLDDYNRTRQFIKNYDAFNKEGYIGYDEVLRAHYLITDYFSDEEASLVYGLKSETLLGSALGRQFTGFGGVDKYSTPIEICGTLFYGLIKNHAFHDGNKRTAFLILIYHLQKHNLQFIDKNRKERIETLAVKVAANELDETYDRFQKFKEQEDAEVRFVIDYLERNTRKFNKRFYSVTFADFDHILKKYNVKLSNPHGGFIDVCQLKTPKGFLGIKGKEKWCKVLQIGFTGWKRKVGMKALKETLKATNLTSDHGYDSEVIFKGAEPLSILIDDYNDPLRRLKDK
ncbi:MAG: type II toxin-antitoxin system death-on-curing family toxin [Bacteroidetes bacterium]|nr:type II toxin-antitoxin system death-on-curing family toxin [Bacteroidota bacterium]